MVDRVDHASDRGNPSEESDNANGMLIYHMMRVRETLVSEASASVG